MQGPINIKIAVNTERILADSPDASMDPDNPVEIDGANAFMIAPTAAVESGQAADHLRLRVRHGQTIHWGAVSLPRRPGSRVFVYQIGPAPDDGFDRQLVAHTEQVMVPAPVIDDGHNTDPPTFTAATRQDYCLRERAVRAGPEESLQVMFYLAETDRTTGGTTILGFFRWNASRTIEEADPGETPSDQAEP